MAVSRQQTAGADRQERGPRARTRRLMLDTAIRLMQDGHTPSVSDVAEAAGVSRATAYRYFPSQAALVHDVVDAALGPILDWRASSDDAAVRVADLLETSMPCIEEFEATFRAALRMSLEQWARRRTGTLGEEVPLQRGHRKDLLRDAIAPLGAALPAAELDRLAKALSLLFGIEALVVLKDLWGLEAEAADEIVKWTAGALLRDAVERAGKEARDLPVVKSGSTNKGAKDAG